MTEAKLIDQIRKGCDPLRLSEDALQLSGNAVPLQRVTEGLQRFGLENWLYAEGLGAVGYSRAATSPK